MLIQKYTSTQKLIAYINMHIYVICVKVDSKGNYDSQKFIVNLSVLEISEDQLIGLISAEAPQC